MIVGVSGFGYTGSGAVFGYLKERDECDAINTEFCLAYMPHGIQDLEYHLTGQISRFYSSDAAIKDFLYLVKKLNSPRSVYRKAMGKNFVELSQIFIKNISQLIWPGWWSYDAIVSDGLHQTFRFRILNRYIDFWEKKYKLRYTPQKNEKIYLSIHPENFIEEAIKYINALIDGFGCDRKKIILLDQPFEANAPLQSMKYYEDARAIIVDRDPRDLYILAKKVVLNKGTFIPSNDVHSFIKYYRLCRIGVVRENSPVVLHIAFEDMIYEYDNTTNKIDTFLGINSINTNRYKFFDPNISINNTQLYLRYPELSDETTIIEKELSEYLYPFYKYDMKPNNEASF